MTFTKMLATCNLESLGLSILIVFHVLGSYTNTQVRNRTAVHLNISGLILDSCGFIVPGQIMGKHLECKSKAISVRKLSPIIRVRVGWCVVGHRGLGMCTTGPSRVASRLLFQALLLLCLFTF